MIRVSTLTLCNGGMAWWSVAQSVKSVGIRAVCSIVVKVGIGSAHDVIGWPHWGVGGVGSWQPNHSIDVFLDVLNQSFDHVDLAWAALDELLDGVVDFLLILTGAA